MEKIQKEWIWHKIDVEKYSNKGKSILQKIREVFNGMDNHIYKPKLK